MPRIKIYDEDMVMRTYRIPPELEEWLDTKKDISRLVRAAIDSHLGLHVEEATPTYKLPRRPHSGRPRKDEDPNYIPPVKRPRGRPRKDEAKSISEKV